MGTTFNIYLPRHMEAEDIVSREIEADLDQGVNESILLVEDEPSILKMVEHLLQELGYNVNAVTSPLEAIQIAKNPNGEIDLLITDVILPDMNGQELLKELESLHPEIQCLFMSGYSPDMIEGYGIRHDDGNYIQKPFSSHEAVAA